MLEAKVPVSPPTPHAQHSIPSKQPVIGRGGNPTQDYLHTITPTPLDKTMCITAASALRCVTDKITEILEILQHGGYKGTYLVDVGFDEEVLNRDEGISEMIHIFLENKVRYRVAQDVAATLFPFPVFFDTPRFGEHCFRTPPTDFKMWDLWTIHGIYHPWIKPQSKNLNSTPPMDGSEPSRAQVGGAISRQVGGEVTGGNGRSGKGKQPIRGSDNDNRGSDDGGGDGGDGGDNRVEHIMHKDRRTQKFAIAFSSILNCHGGGKELDLSFRTNAQTCIKVSSGYHDGPHPDADKIGGPWMEVQSTSLDSEVKAHHSEVEFFTLHLQNTMKLNRESTRSAGLHTTLGPVRSLTFDDKNGTSTNNQTTTMWRAKAVHYLWDEHQVNTRLPEIEVNVLMQYFRSNGSQSFRDWFTQLTQPKDLPVYRNFIHEASVTIDLGLVEEDQNEWTRELTSTDVQDLCGPGEKRSRFPPHVEKLSNYTGVGVSTAEVSMARAFIGRVSPRARTSIGKNQKFMLSMPF